MDAVQAANSGHPGTPMALAPLAHVLYTRVMNYDASDPNWFDRDRFVRDAQQTGGAGLDVFGFLERADDHLAFELVEPFVQSHPGRLLSRRGFFTVL